jgi:hypothetical protein
MYINSPPPIASSCVCSLWGNMLKGNSVSTIHMYYLLILSNKVFITHNKSYTNTLLRYYNLEGRIDWLIKYFDNSPLKYHAPSVSRLNSTFPASWKAGDGLPPPSSRPSQWQQEKADGSWGNKKQSSVLMPQVSDWEPVSLTAQDGRTPYSFAGSNTDSSIWDLQRTQDILV